jgi:hypothetical protein
MKLAGLLIHSVIGGISIFHCNVIWSLQTSNNVYARERCFFVRVNEFFRTESIRKKCHICQYLVSGKCIIMFVIVIPGEAAKPYALTRAGN